MTENNTVVEPDGGCEVTLNDVRASSRLARNDKVDRTSFSGEMQEDKAADEPRHRAFETPDKDEKLSESFKEKHRRADADQEQTCFQPGGRNYWFTQLIKSSQLRKKKGESKEKGGSKKKGASKHVVLDSANAVEYYPRKQAVAADRPQARAIVQNIETSRPENKPDDATATNSLPTFEPVPSNGSSNPSPTVEPEPPNGSSGEAAADTKSVPYEEPPPSLIDAYNMAHGEASRLMAGTVASLEATGKSVKDASDAFTGNPAVQTIIASTSANLESAGQTLSVVLEPVKDEAVNLIVCPAQAIIEILEPMESEFASRIRQMICGAAKLDDSQGSQPTSYPVEHVTVATAPSAEVRSVTSMTSTPRSRAANQGVFQAGRNVRCATPLIPMRSANRGGSVRGRGKVRSAPSSPPPKTANVSRRSWTSASRAGLRKPPAKTEPIRRSSLNPNKIPREQKKMLPVQ